jgi:creatinine amidohydrolase
MLIQQLTMDEFSDGLDDCQTVLIPFGSTEEHGSHLPLDTDTIQAIEVGKLLASRRKIYIAVPVHYGVCRSSRNHPGTISISTETLKALTIDIVTDFYRQGLRNFILLSGHAGGTHMSTLIDSGEQLLEQLSGLNIAVLCEYQLVRESCGDLIETVDDSHAGEIETSRILNSNPELVKGSSAAEFPNFPKGILVRNKRKYWSGGVWGDPGKASPGKGAQIVTLVVDRLESIIDQLEGDIFD